MKKVLAYLLLVTVTVLASLGCDNKNNRSTALRNPYTGAGSGYNYNQPFYQNCGQSNYQYMNPMTNSQMTCGYGQNGMPQFYNQYQQPYATDMWGYPCFTGAIDPMTGSCMNQQVYNYYPMYYQ